MTIDVAAIFLASSILTMLAAIVWVIAILVVNNLVHKYWKPLNLYKIVDPENRFAQPHELKKENK
jgi:hypothetical protein